MPKPWIDDPERAAEWAADHGNEPYYPTEMEQPWDIDNDDVSIEQIKRDGCEKFGWSHFWHPSPLDPQFELCDMCGRARRKPDSL